MQYTVEQIATLVQGSVEGDAQALISSFGKIEEAQEGDLSFISNPKYEHYLYSSQATAVLVSKDFQATAPFSPILIRVANPYFALATLMQQVSQELSPSYSGIDERAFVHPSVVLPKQCYIGAFAYIEEGVQLGEGTSIYPYSYVGKNVTIGENSQLYPHVTVYHNCSIGKSCVLHSGAVIGADGFGFAPNEKGYEKIPQLGNVILEDKVEIGANTCVDRSVMGSTLIQEGTKLDNLVQVGHNCSIGRHTVMAAQGGLAGSSHIGDWCQLGGQVGIAGHLKIGDKVVLAGQTGVLGNIPSESTMIGSPAMPMSKAMRSYSVMRHLPELQKKIKELETKLQSLESQLCDKEQ